MDTRVWQGLYAALAVAGAVLTWKNNLEWMAAEGAAATLPAFWATAFATPIASSLAWDIVIAGMAVLVLVIVETRRLGMWRWWPVLYFVLANGIAAAFAIPLFLLFRERRLAATRPSATS